MELTPAPTDSTMETAQEASDWVNLLPDVLVTPPQSMGTTIVGVGPIGTLATDIGAQDSVLGSSAHIGTPQAPYEVHALPTVAVLTPVPSRGCRTLMAW
eukprot:4159246-Amphidinium_carterae.1